jgi:hypothetical protein
MNGNDFIRFIVNGEPHKTVLTDFYNSPITISGVEMDRYFLTQYLVAKRITIKKLAAESGEPETFVRKWHSGAQPPSQALLDTIERLLPMDVLQEISTLTVRRVVTLGIDEPIPALDSRCKIINEEVRVG